MCRVLYWKTNPCPPLLCWDRSGPTWPPAGLQVLVVGSSFRGKELATGGGGGGYEGQRGFVVTRKASPSSSKRKSLLRRTSSSKKMAETGGAGAAASGGGWWNRSCIQCISLALLRFVDEIH